jgi:hypothetical protein
MMGPQKWSHSTEDGTFVIRPRNIAPHGFSIFGLKTCGWGHMGTLQAQQKASQRANTINPSGFSRPRSESRLTHGNGTGLDSVENSEVAYNFTAPRRRQVVADGNSEPTLKVGDELLIGSR